MRNWIAILSLLCYACTTPGGKEPGNSVALAPDIRMLSHVGDSTLDQGQPLLHTDPNGTVYLSWVERLDSAQHRMRYAVLSDSNWSPATDIASGGHWFVNWADFPQFASDGKGHFIATYLQKSGPGTYAYDVMLTRSEGGSGWTSPVKLNEDGKEAEHGFVSITPNEQGFLVSWLDGRRTNPMPTGSHDHDNHDGGQMTLRAAQLDTEGRKLWEEEVDERTCDCCQTSVASGPGGPMVVYRDRSDKEVRDIYIARRLNGRWESKPLHNDGWVINGCPVNGPQMRSMGNIVAAAWYTEAGNTPAVYLGFSSDAGKTFGSPVRIHDSIPMGRVDLVLADDQTAIVSWMEGDRILVRSCMPDGTRSPAYLVSRNSTMRSAGFPQVTRYGNRLVFAWTDQATKRIASAVLDMQTLRVPAAQE